MPASIAATKIATGRKARPKPEGGERRAGTEPDQPPAHAEDRRADHQARVDVARRWAG